MNERAIAVLAAACASVMVGGAVGDALIGMGLWFALMSLMLVMVSTS